MYKEVVPQTHGYLTHHGEVNLPRVQLMLSRLGEVEDGIFKKRREDELEFRQRQKAKRQRQDNYNAPKWVPRGQFAPQPITNSPSPVQNARQEAYHMRQRSMNETDSAINASNKNAAQDLRSLLKKDKSNNSSVDTTSSPTPVANETSRKRTRDQVEDEDEDANDDVRLVKYFHIYVIVIVNTIYVFLRLFINTFHCRLWEDGFKQRYYSNKFGIDGKDQDFINRVASGIFILLIRSLWSFY